MELGGRMTGKVSKDQTEYDLETAISAAIEAAFPRLGAAGDFFSAARAATAPPGPAPRRDSVP